MRPSHSDLSQRLHHAQRRELLSQNVPLSQIFMDVQALKRLGPNSPLFFLRQHSPHIAGEALAAHTTPWSLKDGVLSVKADSPLQRQELSYAVGRIIRIAQDHLGETMIHSVKAARL